MIPNNGQPWGLSLLDKLKELKVALSILNINSPFISSVITSYLERVGWANDFKEFTHEKVVSLIDEAILTLERDKNCPGLLFGYLKNDQLGIVSIDLTNGSFSNYTYSIDQDPKNTLEQRLKEHQAQFNQVPLYKSSYLFCNL